MTPTPRRPFRTRGRAREGRGPVDRTPDGPTYCLESSRWRGRFVSARTSVRQRPRILLRTSPVRCGVCRPAVSEESGKVAHRAQRDWTGGRGTRPSLGDALFSMALRPLAGGVAISPCPGKRRACRSQTLALGRVVVMFSLPTPPLYGAYGAIQRRLAKEYGVALIPKRCMTRVFSAPGATIDGLHFTHAGHELMAAAVAGLFTGT